MAEFGAGAPGGTSDVPTPLTNTFWIDAQRPADAGPGIPFTEGTASAFKTLGGALAAVDPASTVARFFFVQGDYSNAGTPVDLRGGDVFAATLEGVGSGNGGGGLLPPLIAPLASPNLNSLALRNVTVSPDIDGVSIFKPQNVLAFEAFIQGSVEVLNTITAFQTLFGAEVRAGETCNFCQCDAVGPVPFFLNNAAYVDLATFLALGARGVLRTDGANDALWFLGSPPSPAVEQDYAALQDADRTVLLTQTAGAWCSRNSMTAARALTVTVGAAPDLRLFKVYNWGSGFALTVNGTVAPAPALSIFQNIAGVLTLISSERI